MSYLDGMNPPQKAAVETTEGPVMIIAGAGSGKTRVLTYRIAHLMSKGVDPFNILALTFTNKAAKEMRERVQTIVGDEARNLWMGTFHSIFARILRKEASKLGYPSNFTIYDTDDSRSMIKHIVKEMGLNDKIYKPSIIHNRISSAKNSLLDPLKYRDNINLVSEDESSGRPKIAEIYQKYWNRCFKAGAMDFDDLLFKMYKLITEFPEALYKYQDMFRYILIDEYQDTNFAQYIITKKLADRFQNICVVGDDAQSIYSFRGADITNILNFEKDYPEMAVFKLEQNYRSTSNILEAANKVIGNNKNQLEKKLWTDNPEGNFIKVYKTASDNEEGRVVADRIFELRNRNHLRNSDIAILYRTNAQSRSFEEALRRLNIPYRVYGGTSFYQRKEVKDVLAYLRLVVNHNDEEALRRTINYPARGIGKTSVEKATVLASDSDIPLWEVIANAKSFGFPARAGELMQQFANMIRSFATMLDKKNAWELADHISSSTGILKTLYNDKTLEGMSRYENVQELLNGMREYAETHKEEEGKDGLAAFLQEIMLLTNADEGDKNPDTISLMTIHSAKGLEYPAVFIVGLEEGLFPSGMSQNSREDLEEERRLFYVGITRAEKLLHLSFANTRYRFGKLEYGDPSRFLDELPEEYLEKKAFGSKAPGPAMSAPARKKFAPPSKPKPSVQHSVSSTFKEASMEELQVGLKVEHSRFGFGTISSIDGTAPNKVASIEFEKAGLKKIMLKFAKLSILSMSEDS